MRALANLEAMRGRFDEARALYRRAARPSSSSAGGSTPRSRPPSPPGPVELIAGDAVAAEAELRRDHDALAAMGERNYISTTAAFLAEALYRQGRDDEALAMTEESEAIADDDDVATQYLWRSVRAKLVARGRVTSRERGAALAARPSPSSRPPRTPIPRAMPGSTSPRSSSWPDGPLRRSSRCRRGHPAIRDQGQCRICRVALARSASPRLRALDVEADPGLSNEPPGWQPRRRRRGGPRSSRASASSTST